MRHGKAIPKEFRDDVVKVARLHQAPMTQIAKDFGISDATLYEWMKRADIEDAPVRRIGGPVRRES